MKKLLAFLIIFLLVLGCSPKYYYLTRETCYPENIFPDYTTWTSFEIEGINDRDSTTIQTYVKVVENLDISVTVFKNDSLKLVKIKELK